MSRRSGGGGGAEGLIEEAIIAAEEAPAASPGEHEEIDIPCKARVLLDNGRGPGAVCVGCNGLVQVPHGAYHGHVVFCSNEACRAHPAQKWCSVCGDLVLEEDFEAHEAQCHAALLLASRYQGVREAPAESSGHSGPLGAPSGVSSSQSVSSVDAVASSPAAAPAELPLPSKKRKERPADSHTSEGKGFETGAAKRRVGGRDVKSPATRTRFRVDAMKKEPRRRETVDPPQRLKSALLTKRPAAQKGRQSGERPRGQKSVSFAEQPRELRGREGANPPRGREGPRLESSRAAPPRKMKRSPAGRQKPPARKARKAPSSTTLRRQTVEWPASPPSPATQTLDRLSFFGSKEGGAELMLHKLSTEASPGARLVDPKARGGAKESGDAKTKSPTTAPASGESAHKAAEEPNNGGWMNKFFRQSAQMARRKKERKERKEEKDEGAPRAPSTRGPHTPLIRESDDPYFHLFPVGMQDFLREVERNAERELGNDKRRKWLPASNPWGKMGHEDGDVVVISRGSIAGRLPPWAWWRVLTLQRDRVGLRPWGFSAQMDDRAGACIVDYVEPLSPAAAATNLLSKEKEGLRPLDMILMIGGRPIGSMTQPELMIELDVSGPTLQLVISRCFIQEDRLCEQDEEWEVVGPGVLAQTNDLEQGSHRRRIRVKVPPGELGISYSRCIEENGGARINEIKSGSPIETKLQVGDIITEINTTLITSCDDMIDAGGVGGVFKVLREYGNTASSSSVEASSAPTKQGALKSATGAGTAPSNDASAPGLCCQPDPLATGSGSGCAGSRTRDGERTLVTDVFCRISMTGESEALFIEGYSGSGNSRLVQSVVEYVDVSGAYIVRQKFDQKAQERFMVVVLSAFDELCTLIGKKRSPAELSAIAMELMAVFGNNLSTLARVLPKVALFSPQLSSATNDGAEINLNRVCFILQLFLRVVSSREHPVVLFLDDVHWADAASLDLVRYILADVKGSSCVYFIGSYRSNEVLRDHAIFQLMTSLEACSINLSKIRLDGMGIDDVNHLLSDTTQLQPPHDCEETGVKELSGGDINDKAQSIVPASTVAMLSFDPNQSIGHQSYANDVFKDRPRPPSWGALNSATVTRASPSNNASTLVKQDAFESATVAGTAPSNDASAGTAPSNDASALEKQALSVGYDPGDGGFDEFNLGDGGFDDIESCWHTLKANELPKSRDLLVAPLSKPDRAKLLDFQKILYTKMDPSTVVSRFSFNSTRGEPFAELVDVRRLLNDPYHWEEDEIRKYPTISASHPKWLSDATILPFVHAWNDQLESDGARKFVLGTQFYQCLLDHGPDDTLRRYFKKNDITYYDELLVLIHFGGNHFVFVHVNILARDITMYEPIRCHRCEHFDCEHSQEVVRAIASKLDALIDRGYELQKKSRRGQSVSVVGECPEQVNDYDCGVDLLLNVCGVVNGEGVPPFLCVGDRECARDNLLLFCANNRVALIPGKRSDSSAPARVPTSKSEPGPLSVGPPAQVGEVDVYPLVLPEDKDLVSDDRYLAFEQMVPCNLVDTDRKGHNKSRHLGYPGLACKHCGDKPGGGRFFPGSEASVESSLSLSIIKHRFE